MTPSDQQIQTFGRLFAGRTDAYGGNSGHVKRETVTADVIRRHLTGERPIGVFPLRDDETVRFGAIDLDEPDFELARTFQSLLPGESWLERSRSGNAHVWAFFRGACPAWVVRGVLKSATEALGRSEVEIFPKQDRLPVALEGDAPPLGNYINLPFAGDERPIIHLPEHDGATGFNYPLDGFLTAAVESLNDPDDWTRRARALGAQPPSDRVDTADWGDQPVLHTCAQHLLRTRPTIAEGGRSVVIFTLAKQLLNWRDLDEDEAWDLLLEFHDDCVEPPLPERELRRVFRSAIRGRYTSTGCDDPLFLEYAAPDCPIAHS